MPPLPTDFIFPEACKPICEKLLTLPPAIAGGVGMLMTEKAPEGRNPLLRPAFVIPDDYGWAAAEDLPPI